MPADKGIHAREAITEAARRLFYQKGYGATSYADIAEVTGYGKGNIHYYFKSKNDILNAVT
ncbi:MAG TPA: TetR/AcrR family transcriptional regulator, partial [Rhodobacteraceae bacterium]|nr:TetR/AcrR family transcriptional regulator [Paracoccaceae bacterium]